MKNQKEMKKSSFIIYHCGIPVEVMFENDFAKENGLTLYAIKQKIKKAELKQFVFKNRKRMKRLIAINPSEDTKELFEELPDQFKVLCPESNQVKKVMFLNQYAEAFNHASKQIVQHYIDSNNFDLNQVQIQRGENRLNLVIVGSGKVQKIKKQKLQEA